MNLCDRDGNEIKRGDQLRGDSPDHTAHVSQVTEDVICVEVMGDPPASHRKEAAHGQAEVVKQEVTEIVRQEVGQQEEVGS